MTFVHCAWSLINTSLIFTIADLRILCNNWQPQACKKILPTGPDDGNGQASTLASQLAPPPTKVACHKSRLPCFQTRHLAGLDFPKKKPGHSRESHVPNFQHWQGAAPSESRCVVRWLQSWLSRPRLARSWQFARNFEEGANCSLRRGARDSHIGTKTCAPN